MRLPILLDLTSQQVRSHLLKGLDQWVQLGLLSEAQVIEIARQLSEAIPVTAEDSAAAPSELPSRLYALERESELVSAATTSNATLGESELATEDLPTGLPAKPKKPSWLAQALGSLVEEISVLWLLFLGVFLVVVSSGVLAASQWTSFSAVGQYAILLAYTLAFWGASVWTQRKENLQSTGRMLSLTTLLLIPVNFWMMDRFGVLSGPVGIGVGALAALVLTVMPLSLSGTWLPRRTNRINLIALSWLHWGWISGGWGWALWPVMATYLGTVGTAANLTYHDRQTERAISGQSDNQSSGHSTEAADTDTITTDITATDSDSERSPASALLSFDTIAVTLSILILLFRSLFVTQVPPSQLGLAAGLCGWLFIWLTRDKASRIGWEQAGFGLLLAGWIATIGQSPPLQAIALSLLTISLLWMRLRQTWHQGYLFALLGVGLQTYGLIWSVVPTTTRDRILSVLSDWISIGPIVPLTWASIGLFPFVLLTLALAAYLRRQQQPALSTTTEQTALVVGGALTALSLTHPFTAALNLTLSTATLLWVQTGRRGLYQVACWL